MARPNTTVPRNGRVARSSVVASIWTIRYGLRRGWPVPGASRSQRRRSVAQRHRRPPRPQSGNTTSSGSRTSIKRGRWYGGPSGCGVGAGRGLFGALRLHLSQPLHHGLARVQAPAVPQDRHVIGGRGPAWRTRSNHSSRRLFVQSAISETGIVIAYFRSETGASHPAIGGRGQWDYGRIFGDTVLRLTMRASSLCVSRVGAWHPSCPRKRLDVPCTPELPNTKRSRSRPLRA